MGEKRGRRAGKWRGHDLRDSSLRGTYAGAYRRRYEGPGDSDSKAAADLQWSPATYYLSLLKYNFCDARSYKHSNLFASMSAAAGLTLREGEKMRYIPMTMDVRTPLGIPGQEPHFFLLAGQTLDE